VAYDGEHYAAADASQSNPARQSFLQKSSARPFAVAVTRAHSWRICQKEMPVRGIRAAEALAPVLKFYLGHPGAYRHVPERRGLSGIFGSEIASHPFPCRCVLPISVAISVASVRMMFCDRRALSSLGTPGARAHPRRRRAPSPLLSSPHSGPRSRGAPGTLSPQEATRGTRCRWNTSAGPRIWG
jgi:hypothetical protein